MKFIADVMLGRLARFLRFCGYDVEYDSRNADDFLLKKSRYRILLTKDTALFKKATPGRAYFVKAVGAENQLQEIKKQFPDDSGSTRCIVCNRKIRRVSKKAVQHLVPPFVFFRHSEFYRCPGCSRIYWKGTHYDKMERQFLRKQ